MAQQKRAQLPRTAVDHLDDALEALRWAYSKATGDMEPFRDMITAAGKQIAAVEQEMIVAIKAREKG